MSWLFILYYLKAKIIVLFNHHLSQLIDYQ